MQIKNFAFLVNKLDNSHQMTTLSHNLNLLIRNDYKYSPTVFYQVHDKVLVYPQFPRLMMQHAWGYEGTVISSDIVTTQLLKKCMRATKKIFYVFNLEWLYQGMPLFGALKDIYQDPTIELIARCQAHSDILNRVWKKPIGIVEDFDCEQLTKLL